jgi:peroxiredoxin
MKRRVLFLLLLAAACHRTPAEKARDPFSVDLTTLDGATFDLSTLKSQKATVLVFLAPDCPLSQSYVLTLNTLSEQFNAESVQFLGVVAGEWFQQAEIRQFTETYKLRIPALLDRAFELTDALGATKAPEAFALDAAGEVFYKGAIDNWSTDLGQHRAVITEHYLRDALADHLKGQIPFTRETPAVGCFIERQG